MSFNIYDNIVHMLASVDNVRVKALIYTFSVTTFI